MSANVRVKLAPPPSQWHNCCVPIDVLIRSSQLSVRKRRLFCNVLLFLAYLVTLLVTVLSVASTQSMFMSNSREATDFMFWDRAYVPQDVTRYFPSGHSTAQWV